MQLVITGTHGIMVLSLSDTDLFHVLKKRHACRHFDPSKPVPDELLIKLADAAHRAPTGGNIPYRFVIVVKNPVQLEMLKTISPGYFGDSSAAIVVCTNLKADEVCKVDEEQCTLYDAGAAAENIALAATALGIGSAFIKSYSETAVRTILGLPEGCRTELIISIGYPIPHEPPPLKKRKEGMHTYFDKYGTQNSELMPIRQNSPKTPEQFLFEFALFLLTAAQGSMSEPHIYATLRLLDTISRLTGLYSTTSSIKSDDFLLEAKREIDANKHKAMVSEDEYAKFIDGMVSEFADELKHRKGLQ